MRLGFIVIVAAALFYGNQTRAEIVSAGPSGFNLREVAEVPNPAPVVWAMLSDIGKWWDPEHTYSGDSRNLTLEPFVRGCFCEKLSLYAGIEHARSVNRETGGKVAVEENLILSALDFQNERQRLTISSSVDGDDV